MTDKIAFIVKGEPKGKGRPRFAKSGHTYTPKETRDYEERIRTEYLKLYYGIKFEKGIPLKMSIFAEFAVPKSDSKRLREKKLQNELLPTKKPDADNIVKVVADALNGLAYHDDTQITDIRIVKRYGANPHISVFVER